MQDHVIVVGGGFSGTLLALNLLRVEGAKVTLVEQRNRAGAGLAYGDADPDHLLNVRAAKMSAFPDQADHFLNWLQDRHHHAEPGTFVPRAIYGTYLRDLLEAALQAQPDRLRLVQGAAREIVLNGDGASLRLDDGRWIAGSRIVLAVGNLPPHPPQGMTSDVALSRRYIADPWTANLATDLAGEDRILIIGSGLTMVDMVLRLRRSGFGGRIVAMSRRGLLPHRHEPQGAHAPINERPSGSLSRLVNGVRTRADAIGWRNAVDELRPFTQSLWRAASRDEQSRFLRHLRPWWDIHRHRLAPLVADRIDAEIREGRLHVVAARPLAFTLQEDGVSVSYRPRSHAGERTAVFGLVVNCMGPLGDLSQTRDGFLRWLSAEGLIRPDPSRVGIDVDGQNRVVNAEGAASDRFLAVGPMTRGAFWEINAVPDIRVQVWALARRLSNAHWVEGEGL